MKTEEEKKLLAEEARKAMADYQRDQLNTLEKTKRLRALRLAQSDEN